VVGPDHRPLLVFAPPSSETPKAALVDVKDDDFEPTVADAKRHQQHLQNRTHNQRLLSDAELARQEEEKAAKQAAIREVSIKIRFPDQLTAVASFTTLDTGAKLYEFVRGLMAAENEPFHLVWTGPKGPQTVPDSADIRLIRDLQFSGRMLVNLHWDEGASPDARTQQTLKAAYADQAKAIQVQEIAAAEAEEEIATAAASSKGKEPERGLGSGNKSKGVPKWLKLPGKK
jgi:tether containing UBX domain for GLUT4